MSILNVAQSVQAPVEDFRNVEASTGGSSTRVVVGSGSALVVLTGVVEQGNHTVKTKQGKSWEQDECLLIFHIVGGYDIDNGKPYIEQGGKPIELQGVFSLALKRTSKSPAMHVFNAMNWAKDINKAHFKDFLGQMFSLQVGTELKDGVLKQKVDLTKLSAPLSAETGEPRKVNAEYDLEELAKLFIWNVTDKEQFTAMWKTIENLDTYEKDGVVKGLDFLCDKIRKANNYTTAPWYSYVAQGSNSYDIPDNNEADPQDGVDELPMPEM